MLWILCSPLAAVPQFSMTDFANNFLVCQATREFASSTVRKTLPACIGLTEKQIASRLLSILSHDPEITAAGWYDPPPGGIAVLADVTPPYTRLRYDTLRDPKYWPSDIIFTKDSTITAYVSPVHTETGVLGDFGGTFYFGDDDQIRRHVAHSGAVLQDFARKLQSGIEFSDIASEAYSLFEREELINNPSRSITDPQGINMGHTVPFAFITEPCEPFQARSSSAQISSSRHFINAHASMKVPENGCFTLEAQFTSFNDPELPMVLVHIIVRMANGMPMVLV